MNKTFEIEGRIKIIFDKQTFSRGFTKREFVLTTFDTPRQQDLKFEAIGERIALLDVLQVGDPIKVIFEIRGNEYNERFYVNLTVVRIERGGGGLVDQEQTQEKEMSGKPFEGVELEKLDEKIDKSSKSTSGSEPDFIDEELPF